jgi:hypothetical protein
VVPDAGTDVGSYTVHPAGNGTFVIPVLGASGLRGAVEFTLGDEPVTKTFTVPMQPAAGLPTIVRGPRRFWTAAAASVIASDGTVIAGMSLRDGTGFDVTGGGEIRVALPAGLTPFELVGLRMPRFDQQFQLLRFSPRQVLVPLADGAALTAAPLIPVTRRLVGPNGEPLPLASFRVHPADLKPGAARAGTQSFYPFPIGVTDGAGVARPIWYLPAGRYTVTPVGEANPCGLTGELVVPERATGKTIDVTMTPTWTPDGG